MIRGALFELDAQDKAGLARAEGLGAGYAEKRVTILAPGGPVDALTYYATDKDPALRPYHWYKTLVVQGAREHGLPVEYRCDLMLVETVSGSGPARS